MGRKVIKCRSQYKRVLKNSYNRVYLPACLYRDRDLMTVWPMAIAAGGRALHLTLRLQRRVPLLAIELAHQPAGRKGLRCVGLRSSLVVGAAGLARYLKRERR